VEVAKALGGSFKLVTLAPRTAQGNTKEWRQTNKSKSTNEQAKQFESTNLG